VRFIRVLSIAIAAGLAASSLCAQSEPSPELRRELIEVRDSVWRAFFQKDTSKLEKLLGSDLIAIQESQEKWERRDALLAIARQLNASGIELLRLEFPQTEIQVFGDTAILYYTYIFSTGPHGKPAGVDAGRGTEVFVRRDGRWIDVGWHLDNGPFVRQDGSWTRLGAYPPPAP
jgi:hypothetical protein